MSANVLVSLVSCLLNGTQPEAEILAGLDLKELYALADRHSLLGITAFALEHAGIHDEAFMKAKGRAIRKVLLLSMDREKVISELEANHVWYMPLKGAILKDYYPALGMRESSDCDILIDPARADDVRKIMQSLGFRVEEFGTFHHDVYFRPPVSSFEMHRKLFRDSREAKLYAYYSDTKSRLLKDEGNNYGWHFSTEDFYVYMTAHEYNHYRGGGTGLRSLLDVYVFLKKFGNVIDCEYVSRELESAGLSDFEAANRGLAMSLFEGRELTQSNLEMLDYILKSGTYGNIDNLVKNRFAKRPQSKVKYLLSRIFLPMTEIKDNYLFFYKHKYLLPLMPFMRVMKAVRKSKRSLAEIRTVINLEKR
ncbi:MAG: nucleotidyltransferase family protein [Synergistaceae bacterium]|nr:nucleotidyltransferase family protein [Synergistaceae bacterium]